MNNYRNNFFYSLSSKSRKIVLVIIVFIACLILIFSNFESSKFSQNLRTFTAEISFHLSSFITLPIQMLQSGYNKIEVIGKIYDENNQLKKEQLADSINFQDFIEMKLKVEEYENILNIVENSELNYKTVRIISSISNNYLNSIILDVGMKDGVKSGMPILGMKGLIGFIDQVRNDTTVGILLSNINSRIPVSISKNSFQAIMIGQDINHPKIDFIKDIKKIKVGDSVSTSGRGGIFPPYLLIGEIDSINNDKIRVKLLEDVSQLTYVRIIEIN